MSRLRPRYVILLISMIMIISGITMAWSVQNNFGMVTSTEVNIVSADGLLIQANLQVPSIASAPNPVPGVVVIHGVIQAKEWVMGFGIELTRRGFVVLTIDVVGHGNSDPRQDGITDRGGLAAIEFLHSLPYVSSIGMVGHSMGAGIALRAINSTEIPIDAIVIVGSSGAGALTNATFPPNMLVAVGQFDEYFVVANMVQTLAGPFNTTSPVISGTLYGSFTQGTARKFVVTLSNHLFETIDPIIISETVEWLMYSLKGGPDTYWLPKNNQIYMIHIFGGFIASLGLILSIFPLLAILIDLPLFAQMKQTPSSSYSADTKTYLGLGLIYGLIMMGTFLPFLLLGYLLSFPQSYGLSVSFWLLGSALVATGVLLLLLRSIKKQGVLWKDLGVFGAPPKMFLKQLGLSALLGILCILWLYLWTLPVDLLLGLDFRFFLPLFNDLTISRSIFMPLYLLFTIPFFFVEGIWILGVLRTEQKATWVKTQASWTIKAIFIKCIPYMFVLSLQFLLSYSIGQPFFSGQLGFSLLFLFIFTPMLAITTSYFAWSYRLCNRIYIAVFLNALMFSWILASILPLSL